MVNPRSGPSGNAPTPTIDAVRRRARHRLIGASVLVAVGGAAGAMATAGGSRRMPRTAFSAPNPAAPRVIAAAIA